MNIVFLSPDFPAHYYLFCQQIKHAGANALGISDRPYHELSYAQQDSMTEYYRVDDMHNYESLIRACGYFTHKYGKIDRFDSLNEYWLGTEARIRDDFNIYGIRGDTIGYIRKKSLMKEKFIQAGVPVAKGKIVQTPSDAKAFIRKVGYPVVAKPDEGVGALDTFKLENDFDLNEFFNRKPDVDYIMEEFITGDIYSFDGLTDKEGGLVFYTAHTYSQGIMETVNEGRHVSYYSFRSIPPQLESLGRNCLKAFNVRERFFHMEFFKTAKDTFVGLEVNIRPPGGYTTDMFNYACDIDIYRIWAQLLALGYNSPEYERKYHCCYASRKNTHHYWHSHEAIMARYNSFIVSVVSVPGVFSSALGDVGYIFRSPEIEDIHGITNFIQSVKES